MALVEGVGDEVTLLLGALLLLLLCAAVWLSTSLGHGGGLGGGTLVSVVVLDRDRFSQLLQRVRERVSGGAQALGRDGGAGGASGVASSNDQSLGSDADGPQGHAQLPAESDSRESVEQDTDSTREELDVDQSEHAVQGQETVRLITDTQEKSERETVLEDTVSAQSEAGSMDAAHCPPSCEHGTSVEVTAESEGRGEEGTVGARAVGSDATVAGGSESLSRPEGHVRIRLQFVDGRQRMVSSHPDSTLGAFKRSVTSLLQDSY